MAARENAMSALLTSFPQALCSGYDSSSDDESDASACAYMFEKLFPPPTKRPKIVGYIGNVVHKYSDEGFRRNFQAAAVRVRRPDIRFRGVVILPGHIRQRRNTAKDGRRAHPVFSVVLTTLLIV
ncbi:unnamed protein product [Ixodes hexagonus]